jgi:hypothetical protein
MLGGKDLDIEVDDPLAWYRRGMRISYNDGVRHF